MSPIGSDLSISQLIDALLFKLNADTEWHQGECVSSSNLQVFEQQLVTALAAVRTHRNKLLPVNRLPPEVLSIAFHMMQSNLPSFLLLPSMAFRQNIKTSAWEAVSTVCRKWRAAALSSPSLWSVIDSSSGHPYTNIDRSCSTPLTLYAGISHSHLSFLTEAFITRMANLTSRFKEFHVDLDVWPEEVAILEMFQDPAPVLESLTIARSGKPEVGHTLPTLFNGQTPKLRQLNLEHFTSWPGNHFTDLTHLCLYNQHIIGRPTLSQFIDFLETCPQLQELVLVVAGPMVDDMSSITEHRLVALDHLHELTIGTWSSSLMVSAFLSHLILPRKLHMYLWNDRFGTEMDDLPLMIPADCSYLQNTEGIREVRYVHGEVGVHIVVLTDGVLYIQDNFDVHQILIAMSRALVLDTLESFWVHELTSTPYGRDDWRLLFAALPSLQQLTISSETSRAALSALRSSKEDTQEILLCPLLKQLTVMAERDLPAFFLCAFTEERATQQCPLETLTIMNKELPGFPLGWGGGVNNYGWGGHDGWGTDIDATWGGGVDHWVSSVVQEDHQYLSKYVQHVEHAGMTGVMSSMTPTSWPNPAYSWTTRKQDRWS